MLRTDSQTESKHLEHTCILTQFQEAGLRQAKVTADGCSMRNNATNVTASVVMTMFAMLSVGDTTLLLPNGMALLCAKCSTCSPAHDKGCSYTSTRHVLAVLGVLAISPFLPGWLMFALRTVAATVQMIRWSESELLCQMSELAWASPVPLTLKRT